MAIRNASAHILDEAAVPEDGAAERRFDEAVVLLLQIILHVSKDQIDSLTTNKWNTKKKKPTFILAFSASSKFFSVCRSSMRITSASGEALALGATVKFLELNTECKRPKE
jgi:hypothetical protein